MARALTIKDDAWESQLFRSRLVVSFAFVLVAALVLVGRIVQLQILQYEDFKTQSDDNRVKVVPVVPTRGLIFDRNGLILAQNMPTYSLEVVPERVEDIDALLSELATLVELRDVDLVRFRRMLRKKRRFDSVPLRFRLNEEEVARFAVNSHRFPGVDVQARLTRSYPHGPLAAHLVGYVGRINEAEQQRLDAATYRGTDHIGKVGVEQAFESALHGTVGFQHVETNALGRTLRVLERVNPSPGRNLYLTIDASLQRVAEQALAGDTGAIVAIDPANGAVLAFASTPTFDPNAFVDGIDAKAYRALLSSPDRPLFNRALNGRYPPGSTIKPFIGLAGLEENTEHSRQETWCPGWFRLPGKSHRYRDWKRGGHGKVALRRAIVESCDVYFYELALELGIDRMHRFMTRFGFGRKTGIDLRGESSGLMPSRQWKRGARGQPWYPGETLITGIGQGFMLATPLQLASATSTLAMRGVRLRPQVVLRQESPETGEALDLVPETLETLSPREEGNWSEIIGGMMDVVHGARGTARKIGAGITYRMAGKTGTAQVFTLGQEEKYEEETLDKKLRDHGLFIAFAAVEGPRIAVAVLVENGGSGSKSAAPLARKVIDHFLDGVLRDDDGKLLLTSTDLPRAPRATN
jgi:penicillin-binding protein 2